MTPNCRADCRAEVPRDSETPDVRGLHEYRYRDSNPGFRRERAAS